LEVDEEDKFIKWIINGGEIIFYKGHVANHMGIASVTIVSDFANSGKSLGI